MFPNTFTVTLLLFAVASRYTLLMFCNRRANGFAVASALFRKPTLSIEMESNHAVLLMVFDDM